MRRYHYVTYFLGGAFLRTPCPIWAMEFQDMPSKALSPHHPG